MTLTIAQQIKNADELEHEIEEEKRKLRELMLSVGFMKEGTAFGEYALQYDPQYPSKGKTRAATIMTILPCIFAVMDKLSYQNLIL